MTYQEEYAAAYAAHYNALADYEADKEYEAAKLAEEYEAAKYEYELAAVAAELKDELSNANTEHIIGTVPWLVLWALGALFVFRDKLVLYWDEFYLFVMSLFI